MASFGGRPHSLRSGGSGRPSAGTRLRKDAVSSLRCPVPSRCEGEAIPAAHGVAALPSRAERAGPSRTGEARTRPTVFDTPAISVISLRYHKEEPSHDSRTRI